MLLGRVACAQPIQWASEVNFYHGAYRGEGDYGAKQVLGPPNAVPFGQMSPRAFRLASQEGSGILRVGFAQPQPIKQVVVVESNLPGAVTEVKLYDEYGRSYAVYQQEPQKLAAPFRSFNLIIAETTYKVAQVEVRLNASTHHGWTQIDAIGILNSDEPYTLSSYSTYSETKTEAPAVSFVSKKENLGETVNSKFTEINPVISPDGSMLYFARQNHPQNDGGKRDAQDIWASRRQGDGSWGEAINMGSPLNNAMPNGVASVSPDGNTLLLLNRYNPDGSVSPGVSLSQRQKGGWSAPIPQEIDQYENRSDYVNYYLTNDGNAILMAVDRQEGYGDQDIYISFREGKNKWSKPQNLGPQINTPRADFAPFLAADGRTLYFASEGYSGFGGSDIYFSKRLDESWQRWSTPENMGNQINTPDWDGYYTISAAGDFAYLVSDQEAIGNSRDIFKIALPNAMKPEPVVLLNGHVYDAVTRQPLAATIQFSTLEGGKEAANARTYPEDGSFKVVLPLGVEYSYVAEAPGYVGVDEDFSLVSIQEYREMEQDIFLFPLEKGQTIRLKNIQFERSKSFIRDSSKPTLERLVRLLEENPTLEIQLEGHTDNRGSFNANMKLSEDRVTEVKKYLTDRGIKAKRITLKAYGGTQPIADNEEETTRRLNRRVEFTVTNL
ncbi:OmpA family protein [Catalinimonas alkaloidigena]|nr:OmpA family protein [Catalinimonas alkaloidigena]